MEPIKHFRLRKGFTVRLQGEAEKQIASAERAKTFAVKPTDFSQVTRPKLLVNEGENVKAGTPLFFDKLLPGVLYCAPMSGEIATITRGKKRKLLEIVILADTECVYESFPKSSIQEIEGMSRDELIERLTKSGVWPHLIQRPYGIVADPSILPKAIFMSAFDTHPLAPDLSFTLSQDQEAFAAGIVALRRLSDEALHIGLLKNKDYSFLGTQPKVNYYTFQGTHPAGNVGVQIHHIAPINKGENVWTTTPFGAVSIGRLLLEGRYNTSCFVAVTGPEILQPQYYRTHVGASIQYMVQDNLKSKNVRCISGNVLTGERIGMDGHLGFYDRQVSVLREGNYHEPFGWILPSLQKLSFHRGLGLLSFLFPKKEYRLDTNLHGELRAFAQTGVLERVVPMDILPTHLIKAILAEDYDDMEALGIYEVIEEDLALCEFVDLSKHEIQKILRKGLNLMQNA